VILGGSNESLDMENFQKHIDSLRRGDHVGIDKESHYYKEFLNKILYTDVQFNFPAPETLSKIESYIDLFVDVHLKEENGPIIIIIQRVMKFDEWDIIIGILTLKLKHKDHSFMVDDSETPGNQNKAK
jgi:hypothetical protein